MRTWKKEGPWSKGKTVVRVVDGARLWTGEGVTERVIA